MKSSLAEAGKSKNLQHGRRVAVMQPYFFPYGGYYRLLAAVDLFVILDCVQFPRRGRVHRCEVMGRNGLIEWLTLPLARQSRGVLIRDLVFAPDADSEFRQRLSRGNVVAEAHTTEALAVASALEIRTASVADYLEAQLSLTAKILRFETKIVRSSSFDLPHDLRGQDKIIAIAKSVGASHYINAPGGKALYEPSAFTAAGLHLSFLQPWQGSPLSILAELLAGQSQAARAKILTQCR